MAEDNQYTTSPAADNKQKSAKAVKMQYKGDNISRLEVAGEEVCFEPGETYEVDTTNQFISELIEQCLFVKPPKEEAQA